MMVKAGISFRAGWVLLQLSLGVRHAQLSRQQPEYSSWPEHKLELQYGTTGDTPLNMANHPFQIAPSPPASTAYTINK